MQQRSQVDRKVGAGSVIVGAAIAALVVGGAAAIAGSGVERAPVASVKSQIKKLAKKVAKANKTATKALDVAEKTSKAQGPQGPQGLQGLQGEPGAPGAPGLLPISRSIDAATVSTVAMAPENLGGPSVTFDAGPNGTVIQLMAAAEVNIGNDANTICFGQITSASLPLAVTAFAGVGTPINTFVQQSTQTAPLRFLPPGTHTLRLDYNRGAGTGTCQYRNRQILIARFE